MTDDENSSTLHLVRRAIGSLESDGVPVLLGGGWAEELHGIIPARQHKDIDLYVLSNDLSTVDRSMAKAGIAEIPQKHLPHKRAYVMNGVMVETILVQEDMDGFYTDFWDCYRFRWPTPLEAPVAGLRALSVEALRLFRLDHVDRERHRPC